MSLKSFLRLLQFLFLVFAVLFIAVQIGLDDTVEFLQYGFIKDGLLYLGGVPVFGYIVFYFILYNQKKKPLSLRPIKKLRDQEIVIVLWGLMSRIPCNIYWT